MKCVYCNFFLITSKITLFYINNNKVTAKIISPYSEDCESVCGNKNDMRLSRQTCQYHYMKLFHWLLNKNKAIRSYQKYFFFSYSFFNFVCIYTRRYIYINVTEDWTTLWKCLIFFFLYYYMHTCIWCALKRLLISLSCSIVLKWKRSTLI